MMPTIDKASAIEIARYRANENGWPFPEPAQVTERHSWFGKKPTRLVVETNVTEHGAKAFFTIDIKTAKILKEVLLAVGDKATALAIARKRAEEKYWDFNEPIEVTEFNGWFKGEPLSFRIDTSYGYAGASTHIKIDAKTGEIIEERYSPM